MAPFRQYSFSASGIRSLCWRGDELVDWVGGGRALALDRTERSASISYANHFDAATASRDGRFAVIYERLGTNGLLLKDGKILREIKRNPYHASAYEYPVALFNEPGGRLLLAHCPKSYCAVELEEVETGRPLTASAEREPSDFFHSRLAASPQGKRLLSAGWAWHPWGIVEFFDVARALVDPRHLDRGDRVSPYSGYVCLAEEGSACWLDDDRIAVGASDEPEDQSLVTEVAHEFGDEARLRSCGLAEYDLASGQCLRTFQLPEQAGTILAVGRHHVLSLYRHPKLIDLSSAQVLHVWTELASGLQSSSITWGLKDDAKPPPMCFDPVSGRFAIADHNRITVIEFDRSALSAR
ncbi:MAG: hypothetical protein J2P54_01200 [Bradyrhizobiaceae bacterium]|nr:hypothetical protein [Bradyrhizobiaceae bacterium]